MPNKTSNSWHKELEYELSIIYPDEPLAESVVYRDIFQKGFQRGFQRGLQKAAKSIALRLLERKFGVLSLKTQRQIERLPLEQWEDLCLALLDFQTLNDLTCWLKQHATAPSTPN